MENCLNINILFDHCKFSLRNVAKYLKHHKRDFGNLECYNSNTLELENAENEYKYDAC